MCGNMKKVPFLFCIFFLFLTSCETRTTIANNLPERESNEIVVLLASKGVKAQKVAAPVAAGGGATEVTWDITVPSAQLTQALGILNQAGLPRLRGTNLLDLFGKPGIVPSDLQDRIRYQEGLSEQLATTIRKMNGVIDANVQITFPQEEGNKTLTASVYVKHKGVLDSANNLLVNKIKRLVSSALPGLLPENVTVVTDRALTTDVCAMETGGMEEKNWVSIWSIVMTRDSVFRFQVIFWIFICVIFILASLLTFFIWKFYPLIAEYRLRLVRYMHPITKDYLLREETTEGTTTEVG
jgi:type III secretion protein J